MWNKTQQEELGQGHRPQPSNAGPSRNPPGNALYNLVCKSLSMDASAPSLGFVVCLESLSIAH